MLMNPSGPGATSAQYSDKCAEGRTISGGNTHKQTYIPIFGLIKVVTRSDIDAAEYIATDCIMASKTRRYLTKLKMARECHLQ